MEVTAHLTTSSGFLAQPRLFRRALVRKHCKQLVVCKVSSAEDASNAARQARFLEEIDKLAEARRLESSSPPLNNGAIVPAVDNSMQRSTPKGTAEIDAAQARQAERRFVRVKFVLHLHLEYGQRLKVVGSDLMLGSWALQHAPELQWSDGDRWHVSIDLPANGVYEYKYVILSSDGQHAISWQRGNNCVLAIKPDDDRVEVFDNWDGQPGAAVIANGQSATRETRLQGWANQMDALAGSQRAELRRTRMELVAAQEDARGARADASRLKAALARTQTDMLTAERRMRELERTNQLLRAQLTQSSLTFHKAFETAQRLLSKEPQPWLSTVDEEDVAEELAAAVFAEPSATDGLAPGVDKAGFASDVDVLESLEFLHMLDNSQFGLRSKAAGRMAAAISQGIAGEMIARDDNESALDEQMGATVTSFALAEESLYDDDDDEEGAASVAVEEQDGDDDDDGSGSAARAFQNDVEEAIDDSSMADDVDDAHESVNGRHHHEGVSDKGRASVSAVQDFISRVRQGLGVAPNGEDAVEEEEVDDCVDVAVTEAAPEEQALVAAAANGATNGTTLGNGAPGASEQPVTS